jgi:hypothetical protein
MPDPTLLDEIQKLFDEIDRRLDDIDYKFSARNSSMEAIIDGLQGVRRNLADIHAQFMRLDRHMGNIGSKLDMVRSRLDAMPTEFGWAEAVATPDEDVNFVFTRLTADFTGLPVDIAIGDDTPLVIACPRTLNDTETAAIRHWVVNNKEALSDHWRNIIGSVELVERLKGNGGSL